MSKYVIDDSTLTGIADAIRTKEETSDPIPVEEMAERIGAIETGVTLPTLSNPATAAEILSGYEAIGADGEVVTGTALETASTATAADIMSGKTAYNSAGDLLTGTASAGLKVKTGTLSFTSSGQVQTVACQNAKYVIAQITGLSGQLVSRSAGIALGDLKGLLTESSLSRYYVELSSSKLTVTCQDYASKIKSVKYHIFYE